MKARIIVALYGSYNDELTMYLGALKNSVDRNAPNCEFTIERSDAKDRRGDLTKFIPKMQTWSDAVHKYDDNLVLMDSDCIVLKDPSIAFEEDFDLGYCLRESSNPFNTGVVFVRPNETTRRFFERWVEKTKYWSADKDRERQARFGNGATDQMAFGEVLNEFGDNIKTKSFWYQEWNLCENHHILDDNTRILHLKGNALHKRMRTRNTHPSEQHIIDIFNEYAEEGLRV